MQNKVDTAENDGKPQNGRTTVRSLRLAALVYAAAFTVLCAQEKQYVPPPVTPESQFLELIDLEADPEKQVVLFDLFLKQFPKYEGIGAVYSQLQPVLVQLGKFDRALELGEKLIAIDEGDVEAVKNNVQAAEGKKDDALIKRWKDKLAALTAEPKDAITATSVINTPWVEGGGSSEGTGAALPAIADIQLMPKQAKARLEAVMFNRAIEAADPATKVAMLDQFVKAFPASPHLNKVQYLYFVAYRKAQDDKRALTVAEQILTHDLTREDVLAFTANVYFRQKREFDKIITYSALMLDLINAGPKPEGVSDVDWAREREISRFEAHYMTGMVHVWCEQWPQADRELRAALALHSGQDQLTAAILTSLGWSDYKMRNISDALKFYEQCSHIASNYQKPAEQSIVSIKAEYGLQ